MGFKSQRSYSQSFSGTAELSFNPKSLIYLLPTVDPIKSVCFYDVSTKEERFNLTVIFPLNNINHSSVICITLVFNSYKLAHKILIDISYVKRVDDEVLILHKRLDAS